MKEPNVERALELDSHDALAEFRQWFVVAEPDLIYLDGNSLGRLPTAAATRLHDVVDAEWGERLIRSWNEGWLTLPQRVGGKIARLLGAGADEVVIADSTSVNLFKLAVAALEAQPHRHAILTDDLNFPSDLYILQSAAARAGRECRIEIIPSEDGVHGPAERLCDAMDEDTALVSLSHTVFKSSYTYDMAAINAAARSAGALTLWDLSHSAGALPVALNESGADLAVGCTYKYLNGGPGAPAFLYVRGEWQERLQNPIAGWMGQRDMFDFALEYAPAPGLQRFITGTPPVLAVSAIEPGVDLLLEAGMERVRAKSVQQSEYLVELWEAWLAPLGFELRSPHAGARRGSHVSLGHADGWRINQALIHEMNVLPDFRKPDNIRLGIAPLYTSFVDIYQAVDRLRRVVSEKRYEAYGSETTAVT